MAHGLTGRKQSPEHIAKRKAAMSATKRAKSAARLTCAHGHPWIPENIYQSKSATGGPNPQCKLCHASHALKRVIGIMLEEKHRMYVEQEGLCSICGSQMPLPGHGQGADTDHDHSTGKVRNLLCRRCNSIVGVFETNSGIVPKITAYLERWNMNFINAIDKSELENDLALGLPEEQVCLKFGIDAVQYGLCLEAYLAKKPLPDIQVAETKANAPAMEAVPEVVTSPRSPYHYRGEPRNDFVFILPVSKEAQFQGDCA